jgi:hypothetical protein
VTFARLHPKRLFESSLPSVIFPFFPFPSPFHCSSFLPSCSRNRREDHFSINNAGTICSTQRPGLGRRPTEHPPIVHGMLFLTLELPLTSMQEANDAGACWPIIRGHFADGDHSGRQNPRPVLLLSTLHSQPQPRQSLRSDRPPGITISMDKKRLL